MKVDIFEGYEAIFGQGKLPRKICDWYISKRYSGKKKVVNLSLCKAFWIVFLFAPLWVIWQPFNVVLMETTGLIGSLLFVVLGFVIFFRHKSSFFKLLEVRIKALKDKVCPLVLKYEFEDKDK